AVVADWAISISEGWDIRAGSLVVMEKLPGTPKARTRTERAADTSTKSGKNIQVQNRVVRRQATGDGRRLVATGHSRRCGGGVRGPFHIACEFVRNNCRHCDSEQTRRAVACILRLQLDGSAASMS